MVWNKVTWKLTRLNSIRLDAYKKDILMTKNAAKPPRYATFIMILERTEITMVIIFSEFGEPHMLIMVVKLACFRKTGYFVYLNMIC